jgi:flavin-dependent dehydrogenase
MRYDVAIVGGGPAGSTAAGILKKVNSQANVVVLEREAFPREHVGESQLPPITLILEELGCWDKVEAVGFPVKTGALYRWGNTDDLWRFDFLLGQEYDDQPRPQPLKGQRRNTTFHVERSIYDKILLDHAKELGTEVRECTKVVEVEKDGDRIVALQTENSHGERERVEATYFLDATGHVGFLRRAMGVGVHEPTKLKNIAMWDYWENPKWAGIPGVGHGGIRVRVMSLGYGWIWFIPLGPTRASVGLVTHAEYYKASGLKPSELYARALAEEPHVGELMLGAKSEGKVQSTKDWSFVADRLSGENWFLVGESAGFADPILAAGMTLAQVGARELAYILNSALRGDHDLAWLRSWYDEIQTKRIGQHIRFADYWYSANAHFGDLKAFTTEIAEDAGLKLNPDEGFRWLAAGGFASDDLTSPIVGTYQLGSAKFLMQVLTGERASWEINKVNEFRLNLSGAQVRQVPYFHDGRVESVKCYARGPKLLPILGMYKAVVGVLETEKDAATVVGRLQRLFASTKGYGPPEEAIQSAFDALEGMLVEGWIVGKVNKKRPFLNVFLDEGSIQVEDSAAVPA